MSENWSGPGNEFYFDCGFIIDWKFVGIQLPGFVNAAVGDVFDDFYQQNRMVIKDCFGDLQYFHFTERHFQKIKTGADTWKLVEVL